jgi:hypothetical protein
MSVIDQYKYQLHFHCPSCGHAWVVGHHTVTLEEPCPRWFCEGEPIANYTYERSPQPEKMTAGPKRSIKSAA